jgi:hypothetical protein
MKARVGVPTVEYPELMAGKVDSVRVSGNGRGPVSGSWRARVHPPRIAEVDERIANVERATKRVKTDVRVDFVRGRRARRR